jgi:predicted RNA-binding protein with PUA-like domain
VNGASAFNGSACNNVNNTNTIATSRIENVSVQSETSVDTSQYNELSLPTFSDSWKQVAVHFIGELDEYFTLRKNTEELRLPLVFHSISDPFAKQWMLTAFWQLKSYDDFKKDFTELLWDGTRQSETRCRVY